MTLSVLVVEFQTSVKQRTVVSFVSSVFDPIGLVAPYTIGTRLLLKDIWHKTEQKWINPLPEALRKQYIGFEWHSSMFVLGEIAIPRGFFSNQIDQCKLHMLEDSLQDVFCAVGFLCARFIETQKTDFAIVFSKQSQHQ